MSNAALCGRFSFSSRFGGSRGTFESILERALNIAANTLALVSAVLALACCQPDEDERLIPSGTYTPATGQERIWVSGRKIRFLVSVTSDGHERKVDRGFEGHIVRADGKIHPYPMRSMDNARGIGSYSWYWIDDGINQRERETGKVIERFERRERSKPEASASAAASASAPMPE